METTQRLILGDARQLPLEEGSVHLVVTSPPYPMVEMWDGLFTQMDPAIGPMLAAGEAGAAFEAMHLQLDPVWRELARVLVPGGIAAINIGDAVRTLGGEFQLHPNHARILTACMAAGLSPLPDILWRKPTNGPTKFMGSGMLPGGAYVTYEHEYVLILRKGGKRVFDAGGAARRRESAYFWEERNQWFSDLWSDVRGTRQGMEAGARERSAAFPLTLPWRLVLMYSLLGDTVLDPFVGTGTTLLAAACAGRSGVGVELDPTLAEEIGRTLDLAPALGLELQGALVAALAAFLEERAAAGKSAPLHRNEWLGMPVITKQEAALQFQVPLGVEAAGEGSWRLQHQPWSTERSAPVAQPVRAPPEPKEAPETPQLTLFRAP